MNSLALLGYILASALPIIIVLYFFRRRTNKYYKNANLNAPLVANSEFDRELAAKEASGGFTACASCGFENFKRVTNCGLCGHALASNKNKKSSDSSARKQRASIRNQWQRKVDVEGNLYWYRCTASSESAKTQFPGYTVLFCHNTPPVDSPLVTDTIRNECASVKVELVESSKANPVISPLGGLLDPIQNRQELIELSAQPFPAKYASFTASSIAALAPTKSQVFKLTVARAFAFEQTMEHVSCFPLRNVRSGVDVRFTEDPRASQNMQREWFNQVSELVASPGAGLFKCVSKADQTFYLNPASENDLGTDHLTFFFAAGRLLGRGLLEGNLWGFHLSLLLLKIILGLPVSVEDLEYFDSELYKNLVWLTEHDNVESLGLTFSVMEQMGDELVVVDLVPNGRNIAVMDANKREYIERKFKYTLFECVAPQLYAFLKGIYEVVPQHLLFLFDAEELDYVLCGADEIDFNDWKSNSKYTPGLHEHPALKHFWNVVEKMPLEYQKRLLHFVTGSSRVPLGGFSELTNYAGHQCPFTLKAISFTVTRIVRAHSCFNRLDLPLFTTQKDMKNALYTILNAEMYQHISS